MAKTTAPLFSLSASGTVARALSFRTTAGRQVAQVPKLRQAPQTAVQVANSANWRDACRYWFAMSDQLKDEWRALGAATSTPPLAVWCREWVRQRATPSTPPLIPVAP